MEAAVTLKLTVQELDIMRDALQRDMDVQSATVNNPHADVRERSAARGRFTLVSTLLKKLT